MDAHVVGVLGGGQLGRMLVEAAHRLNIEVVILDATNAPAKQINALTEHVDGSFAKAADVRALSAICNVITIEIEHVDTKVLEELEEETPFIQNTIWSRIQPSWRTIRTIQDKFAQKQHLIRHCLPTAESIPVGTSVPQGLKEIADRLGYPLMLKSRTEAYDGRGNYPVRSVSDIEPALKALADRPLYAEKWVNFMLELAVMVVKTSQAAAELPMARSSSSQFPKSSSFSSPSWDTSTHAYPAAETIHEDSICKLVFAPARNVPKNILIQAQNLARRAVATFPGCGVFGVEMFLLDDDTLLINEIAPRPHNSGHYTIEACHMSQYEAHLRAILPGLSQTIAPGATELLTKDTHAVMLNILGGPAKDSHLIVAREALKVPGAKVHLYGKGDGRPGRKMGHITIVGSSMEECEQKIQPLINWVDAIHAHNLDSKDSESEKSINATERRLSFARSRPRKPKPIIGVTMGSDSDLGVLKPGLTILDDLQLPYEVTITSAHRTPDRMIAYAKEAAPRGLKVIIAAAGGAAHLPGMLASSTPLPVIGVPVKGSTLDGMDSLLSIVQMPRGVPVASVAINNSTNAALLAARIVGANDERVREQMERYMKDMEEGVLKKAEKLEGGGWKSYA